MNDNTLPDGNPEPGLHRQLAQIWDTGPGLQRLAAINHTVLGVRFMATAFVFFAIAGILGMLTRVQLATAQASFMDAETYNQVFTMHGSLMLFLFAIPMVEGIAVYLTPKILGARDFAFPRLTAYGYWCYLFGGMILTAALIAGVAPDGGWFMYTPLSSKPYTPGVNADVWLLGVTFVEISALTLAVEVVVSVLKVRAPGMSLDGMPIFGWYMLVAALMMIVAFPPLILASILLEAERAFGLPFFDPSRGGDPLLWQHLFWFFGHPDVYIILLPMAGLLSTMIPVFARTPLVGYRSIVVSVIGLAFVSFGIWVHHMFTVGIPHLALALFSAGSVMVAVPTAIQVFAWLATLAAGRPWWNVPMLYIFGFFATFTIGGLTGVMLAVVPFNWQAHDTYFVVGHFHYVIGGAAVFPLLAALYYWLPLLSGRKAVYQLAVPAFWLIFVGFTLTFLPMHLTGLLGMPRRVYTYPQSAGWGGLNLLSSVGGFVMTFGFALLVIDLVAQVLYGHRVRRGPWQASTLEWAMPVPPASYAFASLPTVDGRADQVAPDELAPALARGEGYLGFSRNGWQETLGVSMTSGAPEQLIVLPRRTFLPLYTALATAAAVLAMLLHWYVPALSMVLVTAGLFVLWGSSAGHARDYGALPVGHGLSLPPHTEVANTPPWLALIFSLVADATLFTSLAFGALYLRISAPNWPPEAGPGTDLLLTAGAGAALFAAAAAARGALRCVAAERGPLGWTAVAALALLCAIAALAVLIADVTPNPTAHALGATSAALLGYALLHAAIGLLFLASNVLRYRAGFISARRILDMRLTRLWLDYTAVTGAVALGLALALPALVAVMGATP